MWKAWTQAMLAAALLMGCSGPSGGTDDGRSPAFQVEYENPDGVRGSFVFEGERLSAEAHYPQGALRDAKGRLLAAWMVTGEGAALMNLSADRDRTARALHTMSMSTSQKGADFPESEPHYRALWAFIGPHGGTGVEEQPKYEAPQPTVDDIIGGHVP